MNKKMTERRLQLRSSLWPELKAGEFWNRKTKKGFTTIPRTMPYILQIIDSLSKNTPASSTYFELWCRSFDEYIVDLKADREMAFAAGFTGQRAVQTWRLRLDILESYGFIKIAEGASGKYSHAAIPDPYRVIKRLRTQKNSLISGGIYNALAARAAEIGADDLNDKAKDESGKDSPKR